MNAKTKELLIETMWGIATCIVCVLLVVVVLYPFIGV
jgi:hypothetical protein